MAAGEDVRLTLVGSGPEHARLHALAAPLGDRVEVLPAEDRDALWERMATADLVVVPSRSEGLGMVALEALALGTPVLASRVGGLPEVVVDPDDGALVPPGDAAALAGALAALGARPRSRPTARAVARHAPAGVVQAHAAAYRQALAG